MNQATNLRRLLCRSKFESQYRNHEVKNCGKNCVSSLYLLKPSLYQVNKTFFLKNCFNFESSNLIYIHLPRMQRRIYRRDRVSRKKANKYLQATYNTAAISTIGS